jgi:hypothetical protein
MRLQLGSRPEPRLTIWGLSVRESILFAAGFWLITYATLSIWAILVTAGTATPFSPRRLITTAVGTLLFWLSIRLHASLQDQPASRRAGLVLGVAALFCLLIFAVRLSVYHLLGGAQGAEIGNNVQWLLLWAGYFLAGIGIFAATSLSRALSATRSAVAAEDPPAPPADDEPVFWIERAGARHRVAASDVEWFAAEGNYVQLHGRGDGAPLGLVRATLAGIESSLDRAGFVRLHRSIICRASAIRALRRLPTGASVAVLENGAELAVGRRYRPLVDRMLGRS